MGRPRRKRRRLWDKDREGAEAVTTKRGGEGGLASRLPRGPGQRTRAKVSTLNTAPDTEDPAVPAGVTAGPRGALGGSDKRS